MKLTISYSYSDIDISKYKAKATDEDGKMYAMGSSLENYEEAKKELLSEIKRKKARAQREAKEEANRPKEETIEI